MRYLILLAVLLTGCAAQPQFIRGSYYMTGDSNCRYWQLEGTALRCMDSNHNFTGYRSPMTNQQLQMHMHKEQMQSQGTQSNRPMNCLRTYNLVRCY